MLRTTVVSGVSTLVLVSAAGSARAQTPAAGPARTIDRIELSSPGASEAGKGRSGIRLVVQGGLGAISPTPGGGLAIALGYQLKDGFSFNGVGHCAGGASTQPGEGSSTETPERRSAVLCGGGPALGWTGLGTRLSPSFELGTSYSWARAALQGAETRLYRGTGLALTAQAGLVFNQRFHVGVRTELPTFALAREDASNETRYCFSVLSAVGMRLL